MSDSFEALRLPTRKVFLEGTGKFMRHVKLGPGRDCDAVALSGLVSAAYSDMKARVQAESRSTTSRHTNGKRA